MTLGEKIRARRKELGMTMEDLGRAVGVQRSAINKYEKDMIKDMKESTIRSLAKALDVSPMYLLEEDTKESGFKRLEVTGRKGHGMIGSIAAVPHSGKASPIVKAKRMKGVISTPGLRVDKHSAMYGLLSSETVMQKGAIIPAGKVSNDPAGTKKIIVVDKDPETINMLRIWDKAKPEKKKDLVRIMKVITETEE